MRRFVFLKGLTMADSNYILTPEGRQKLEEELHYLETEKRAEVGERIKVPASSATSPRTPSTTTLRTSRA